MSYRVTAGGDNGLERARDAVTNFMLYVGDLTEIRFFNGGRDAREDARAAALLKALELGLPAMVCASYARLGGPCVRGRGRRFLCLRQPGRVELVWCDWRRAKKLLRDRRACIPRISTVFGSEF